MGYRIETNLVALHSRRRSIS